MFSTVLAAGCNEEKPVPPTLFTYVDPADSGISFTNLIEESPSRNISDYDYFYNGAGVAIGDLDNDGLPEIFFTGNDVDNRLYKNLGDLRFEDVTSDAGVAGGGWATGASLVDINQDGLLDIYVCRSGPDHRSKLPRNQLFVNQGNLEFVESAKEFGLDDPALSTQANFVDVDGDGDRDLFLLNHSPRNLGNSTGDWFDAAEKLTETQESDFTTRFFENKNGRFKRDERKLWDHPGFGLGIVTADFTGNGAPDVYVANDYFIPDQLYRNDGRGNFEEKARNSLAHTSYYSMGCDAADINNDGWTDLVVLDMTPADHYRSKMMMSSMDPMEFKQLTEHFRFTPQYMANALQMNNGYGLMSEVAQMAGVARTDWSWAPLLADFDNDGLRDLYVTNGVLRDVENNDWRGALWEKIQGPDYDEEVYFQHLLQADSSPLVNPMYHNENGMEFNSVSEDWGLTTASFSNGAGYADLDADGDLDLVVNNINEPAFVIENHASVLRGHHFVRLDLRDEEGLHYPSYAKIEVKTGQGSFFAENTFVRGYQSFVEPIIHVGLGTSTGIDEVIVTWADKKKSVLKNLQIDKLHVLDPGEAKTIDADPLPAPMFSFRMGIVRPPFTHKENEFDDFAEEILLPHRMSHLGPGIVVADFNGDGNDDFFVGGAQGQEAGLFFQEAGEAMRSPVFTRSHPKEPLLLRDAEVLGASAQDTDGDGDLDLYIAMGGGGDTKDNPELLQDILLENSGDGSFVYSSGLPGITSSTQVIRPFDFDNDGDMDLFVGGRNTPGKYPLAPRSYLLRNDGGVLTDILNDEDPLAFAGMITDASWSDFNKDGQADLLVTGEWMGLEIFIQQSGTFEPQQVEGLSGRKGWWNCVDLADVDGDGDLDIIAGNLGRNNKFNPTPEKPLRCFAGDMDANGTLDIILAKTAKDQLLPVRGKECSTQQVPLLDSTISSYNLFASSSLESIYGRENLENSYQLTVTGFESGVFINENGLYRFEAFPIEAQIAPISHLMIIDLNDDGLDDIIYGGNNSHTEVETTAYDAGRGGVLFSQGDGTYTGSILIDQTGLVLAGDLRGMIPLTLGKVRAMLTANNNGGVQVWEIGK